MYFPRVTGKCQSIVRYQGKTKQKKMTKIAGTT